ncbi:MAG TPA: hypothetical protein VFF73_41760 [Planctomycetota bacterium]|nr:hypothetical protein [Planctomycetota bacterium]
MIGKVLLVAAGLALAATGASAGDLVLKPAEGPHGMSVRVEGIAFTASKVEVLANGRAMRVNEAKADHVWFFLDHDCGPGPTRIEVKLEGRVAASGTFTVLHLEGDELKKWVKDHGRGVEGDGVEPPPAIDGVKLVFDGPRAIVTGDTKLPDNFTLGVALSSHTDADTVIAKTKVVAKAGHFRAEFGPYTGKTIIGKFVADVEFRLDHQALPDQHKWTGATLSSLRDFADVGTPEDEKKLRTETREHYLALAKDLSDQRTALEKAYAAAGRSYFKTDAEHEDWVKERGLTPDKNDRRFLRSGFFDAEAWQKWIEETLWKKLRALAADEAAFSGRFLGARNDKFAREARMLLAGVVKLAQRDSREIYERNKLEVPVAIAQASELPTDDAPVSREEFVERAKRLEESLPR